MPIKARIYISATIAAGLVLLAGCLVYARDFADLPRYLGYLSLACIGSTLKIKLPKIRGTMSINFLFILIGVAELTIAETITLGCVAALIQCLWKARKQPALVQVRTEDGVRVVVPAFLPPQAFPGLLRALEYDLGGLGGVLEPPVAELLLVALPP